MDGPIFPTPSVEGRATGLGKNFANREKFLADGANDVPPDPLLALRGQMCIRCLAGSPPDLKACGACKRVYYCSEQCQKVDWSKVHKQYCKAFRQINAFEDEEYDRAAKTSGESMDRSWPVYQKSLLEKGVMLWQHLQERRALNIIDNQAYCNACHLSAYQLKTHAKTSLEACTNCQLSFRCGRCSAKPANHPARECELYQLLSADSFYLISRFNAYGETHPVLTIKASQGQSPRVSSLSGWFEYYARLQNWKLQPFVDPNGFKFMSSSTDISETDMQRGLWAEMRAGTETSTMSMTIANGLESALPSVHGKTSLLIHIIGANRREFEYRGVLEDILHLFPSLRSLKTVLIGPEVPPIADDNGKIKHDLIDQAVCKSCTVTRRKRLCATYQGLYHKFMEDQSYVKPDLAVTFNSGQSLPGLRESWTPSMRMLVAEGILTLGTAISKDEADDEMAEMTRHGARIVRTLEENKWKSMLPSLQVEKGLEHQVAYVNHFWYMFQGKTDA